VVEASLYRLREGCRWRALPHDFPPWESVYGHWRRWKKRGKKVKGRSRHVAIDSQGTLLAVHVCAANKENSQPPPMKARRS
jgi:hypothetical protein